MPFKSGQRADSLGPIGLVIGKFLLCGISSSPLDYMWGSKIAAPENVPGSSQFSAGATA